MLMYKDFVTIHSMKVRMKPTHAALGAIVLIVMTTFASFLLGAVRLEYQQPCTKKRWQGMVRGWVYLARDYEQIEREKHEKQNRAM